MNYETLKISESGYEGTRTCYERSEERRVGKEC